MLEPNPIWSKTETCEREKQSCLGRQVSEFCMNHDKAILDGDGTLAIRRLAAIPNPPELSDS